MITRRFGTSPTAYNRLGFDPANATWNLRVSNGLPDQII
jgi:hypothetical protein